MTSKKGDGDIPLRGSWKLTWPLAVGMLVPTLGSAFPLGYGFGALNSPQRHIRDWVQETLHQQYGINLTEKQELTLWAVIVSIFITGAFIAAPFGSSIANKKGRRYAFLCNHLLALSASVLFMCCKVAGSVEMLIIGRLILGLSAGFGSSIMPLYLSEIAPQQIKGSINGLFGIGFTLGLILSMISGSESLMGTEDLWSYHIGEFGVFVAISIALHIYLPESPTYCYMICKDDQAGQKVLTALRGNKIAAEQEGNTFRTDIYNTQNNENNDTNWTILKIIKTSKLRLHFVLVIMICIAFPLSGIGAMTYYSNIIFTSSGLSQYHSEIAIICAVSSEFLSAVFCTYFLLTSCRRRILLLISMSGCLLSLILLFISLYNINEYEFLSYISMISVILHFNCFQLGLAHMPFVLGTELMVTGPRSVALSLGPSAIWLTDFLVGISFPLLQNAIGEFSLFLFIIPTAVFGVIVIKYLPETYKNENKLSESMSASDLDRENPQFELL